MDVVKSGDHNKFRVRFSCNMCGCVFIANEYECTEYTTNHKNYYVCECPECGYYIRSRIKVEVK